jgi:hypothetical protein
MMNDLKILNPTEAVQLSAETVEVRQLPFLRALEFMKQISSMVGALFDERGRFKLVRRDASQPDAPVYDLAPLKSLIESSADLAVFLLKHSTGKDDEWVAKLSASEGLTLLHAALRLNLSKEVLALGNEMAAFLAGAFSREAATKTTAASSKPLIS